MNVITNELVKEANDYVFKLLSSKLPDKLVYHSIKHTKLVLKNTEEIGKHSNLNEHELNILRVSALFHDVGFIDIYDGHEEKSAEYAKEFLIDKSIDVELIDRIEHAIIATKVPQSPHNLISRILCDADLMYLSDVEHYLEDIELLRKEWSNCGKGDYSKKEFYKVSLDFFKQHRYHTYYGMNTLKPKKEFTEKLLLNKIESN